MTSDQIRGEINETIVDVLDLDDDSAITADATAKDIVGWDSLRHVRIMLSLERKFNFRFDETEITSLKRVGDIYDVVSRRLAASA